MRASLYNAFELEGVKVLVDFMKEFELKIKGNNIIMKDIKTYNVIAQEGLDELPADMYTVNKSTKPDALLIRSQDMHKTPFGTSVLAIARAGAGVNNIPLESNFTGNCGFQYSRFKCKCG